LVIDRRRTLRRVLVWTGLAVTVLFGYFAIRDVRFDDVWHAVRDSDPLWIAPSLVVLAVAVLLRAVRWRSLFAGATRPGLRPVTEALLVGYFFNNVLPARAGEAARVVVLKQRAGTSRSETVATVVLERAYDVLALLVLFFVALPWLPEVSWLPAAAALAAVVGVALLAGIVLLAVFKERLALFLLRPLRRLPLLPAERVDAAARNLTQGLVGLRVARIGIEAFLWTITSWLVVAASFWLLMLGFDLGLSPLAGLLVVIATNLALILPSSPAGVGVFEAAAVVALDAYGVERAEALSYALVLHALNFLPYLVVGALVLRSHAARRRRSISEGAQAVENA
jgi:uncharacterized protein (TIRG00374 family)